PDRRNDFDPGRGTYTLPNGGGADAFLVKLDANRNFVWAKSWGGPHYEAGGMLQLDSTGNVYVAGAFGGIMDADPGPGTVLLNGTNSAGQATDSGFVSKFTSAGNLVWAAATPVLATPGLFGGLGDMALDGAGNIYTTGVLEGAADFAPGPGTYTLTSTPGPDGSYNYNDAFVCELTQSSLQPAGVAVSTLSGPGAPGGDLAPALPNMQQDGATNGIPVLL